MGPRSRRSGLVVPGIIALVLAVPLRAQEYQGENIDLWRKTKATGLFTADTLWLGGVFLRDTTKPLEVWLHGNDAGWRGALYFMVPQSGDSAHFLFHNKDNTGPTRVRLDTLFRIGHLDTLYFMYRALSCGSSGCPTAALYTGPNRRVGDPGFTAYDRYSSDLIGTKNPLPGQTITARRRWSVAGWVPVRGARSDTVEFGFEDAGNAGTSEDFDDIVFHITGVFLNKPSIVNRVDVSAQPAGGVITAGTRIDFSGTVFVDSGQTGRIIADPDLSARIRWSLIGDTTSPVGQTTNGGLTNREGSMTSFTGIRAYTDYRIVAEYVDTVSGRTVYDTMDVHVDPGAPAALEIQADSVADRWLSEPVGAVSLSTSVNSAALSAFVRDRYGNLVGPAPGASWLSSDAGIVSVSPAAGATTTAGAVQSGLASVSASLSGVSSDTVVVTVELAGLVAAVTRDGDGDGYLDRIDLTFDSTIVLPPNVSPSFFTVTGEGFTLPVDSVGDVDATGRSFSVWLTPSTSGPYQTGWLPTVSFAGAGTVDAVVAFTCNDGAGPVAARAVFYPGRRAGGAASAANYDTLRVWFSESVTADAWQGSVPEQAFLFVDGRDGVVAGAFAGLTARTVSTSTRDGQLVATVVLENSLDVEPLTDSLTLVGASPVITDAAARTPPSAGRTVVIEWGADPGIVAGAAPNPFVPDQTPLPPSIITEVLAQSSDPAVSSLRYGTVVMVDAPKGADGGTGTIYDVVGNVVIQGAELLPDRTRGKWYLIWDGRNSAGRTVGTGTYVAVLALNTPEGPWGQRLKLGVKR